MVINFLHKLINPTKGLFFVLFWMGKSHKKAISMSVIVLVLLMSHLSFAIEDYSISGSYMGLYIFDELASDYSSVVLKDVSLSNNGTNDLTNLSVTLTGANADSFELSELMDTELSYGERTPLTVKPKLGLESGSYSATITITADNGFLNEDMKIAVYVIPDETTITSTTPGDGRVTLNWDASIGADRYYIYGSTTSGDYTTPLITTDTTGTSKTITGLANGTTYYFVVTASVGGYWGGASDYSNEVAITPSKPVPSAPTLTSINKGDTEMTVNWNSVSGATGYKIYQGDSSDNLIEIASLDSSQRSYLISGLTKGQTYYFAVSASNTGGESDLSNIMSDMILLPAPTQPTITTVLEGDSKVELTWDLVDTASQYKIYQSSESGGTFSLIATVDTPTTSYEVTGLTNGQPYYFTLCAVNDGGESLKSTEVNAMPQGLPSTPLNVSATSGSHYAVITFNEPAIDGGSPITEYEVIAAPGDIRQTGTGLSIRVTGLSNNTSYTFTVKAKNANGWSLSSEASNSVIPRTDRDTSSNASSNSSSDKSDSNNTNGLEDNVIIWVNGVEESAGIETKSTEDGVDTVSVKVEKDIVENRINAADEEGDDGNSNSLQVPIADTSTRAVRVELTGDIVKKLEEKKFEVSVKRDDVEYIIPAEEFTISNVAQNLGVAEEDLEDIKVEIRITKLDETLALAYEEETSSSGAEIIFPPVAFEVVAKTTKVSGETDTVTLEKFTTYVERVVELSDDTDPSKITTGIVFNADGSYSHVPTRVYEENGKWYAKLNSLTNSNYAVVFNDIEIEAVKDHWSEKAVNNMASRLVITSTDLYEPDASITRAEYTAYLVKALGLYRMDSVSEISFLDVEITSDYALAIQIAKEYGIVSGDGDGTFRPDDSISRQEAMVMMDHAMTITKLVGQDTLKYQTFSDIDQVNAWAMSSVERVVSAHIFNGSQENLLESQAQLTYGEAAQSIQNLLVESNLINP